MLKTNGIGKHSELILDESIYGKREVNPQKIYTKGFYVSGVRAGCGGTQKKIGQN